MTTTNPVGWFEIPVNDIDRAATFYETVFGVKLQRMDMGEERLAMFEHTGEAYGTGGTLVQGSPSDPSVNGTTVYFTAPDMEDMLERVKANGGEVIHPITSLGEHGWYAFIKDTEGNKIGLHRN